jgi:hypothetical protein
MDGCITSAPTDGSAVEVVAMGETGGALPVSSQPASALI